MMELIEMIALPVLCVLLWRNHLFAAICYGLVVYLLTQNMTMMLFPSFSVPIVVSIAIFLVLFYLEYRNPTIQEASKKSKLLIALSILRIPVNWNYLGDFIFRLQNWAPIVNDFDQPSLGAAVGLMILVPATIVLILSIILMALYIKKLQTKL